MALNEKSVVAVHEDAGPGYRFLVLDAPQLAAVLVPGQFVHVRVPGLEPTALRRPFSVFDAPAPKAYQSWHCNIVRNKMGDEKEYSSTAMTLGDNRNMDMFGIIKFAGKGE